MSQDQHALDAAYRRASAEDAGRPDAATRRAILEQAANAARQRTPAVNDARFVWRAAAGVAVLGVAVLLWRQMDHRMPGRAPVVVPVAILTDSAPPAVDKIELPLPASPTIVNAAPAIAVPEPAPPPPPPPPPLQTSPAAEVVREADMQLVANEALATTAPAAAAADEQRLEEVQVTGSLIRRGVQPAATTAVAREAEASDLLRDHFPAVFQSRERRTVWLVRDARGAIVMSGELAAAQRLADITAELQPTYGASLGAWRTQTVTNARNQRIVVAIIELQP